MSILVYWPEQSERVKLANFPLWPALSQIPWHKYAHTHTAIRPVEVLPLWHGTVGSHAQHNVLLAKSASFIGSRFNCIGETGTKKNWWTYFFIVLCLTIVAFARLNETKCESNNCILLCNMKDFKRPNLFLSHAVSSKKFYSFSIFCVMNGSANADSRLFEFSYKLHTRRK